MAPSVHSASAPHQIHPKFNPSYFSGDSHYRASASTDPTNKVPRDPIRSVPPLRSKPAPAPSLLRRLERAQNQHLRTVRPQNYNQYCVLCKVACKSKQQWFYHTLHPRHIKKVEERTVDKYCTVCRKNFDNVEHFMRHFDGKKHQQNLKG